MLDKRWLGGGRKETQSGTKRLFGWAQETHATHRHHKQVRCITLVVPSSSLSHTPQAFHTLKPHPIHLNKVLTPHTAHTALTQVKRNKGRRVHTHTQPPNQTHHTRTESRDGSRHQQTPLSRLQRGVQCCGNTRVGRLRTGRGRCRRGRPSRHRHLPAPTALVWRRSVGQGGQRTPGRTLL